MHFAASASGWIAAMSLWAASSCALALAPPRVDDCAPDAAPRVLQPVADAAVHPARALWIDAATLRWPGQPAEARYVLHHSARFALRARVGHVVEGGDDTLRLEPAPAPLDEASRRRVAWAGAGVDLALAPEARPRLASLLRGQLLLVREDAQGRVLEAAAIQHAGALDALYRADADADDLGLRLRDGEASFTMWAPTAHRVTACLYPPMAGKIELQPLQRAEGSGLWRARRDIGPSHEYYAYLVDVFVPGLGLVRNRVTDPYSISLDADSRRSWIGALDAPGTMPPGWALDRPPARVAHATDMVIYELHVRDFSRDDERVPAADRGRYLGFTHPDSHGMRHLRALAQAGVTDLHLLPVFDIASVPERGCVTPAPQGAPDAQTQQQAVLAVAARDCFNWGYDPWHYSAPEGSYASTPDDGAVRLREFRQMVMALHRAGLRVGMDVVYNHTSASGQDPKSVLDRIVPGYYHRLDADGAITRSTCCENTATENAMMAKLMRDSVVTWARDHHIDSFRFDLMGHQPRDEMLRLQREVDAAAGRPVQLIGEGWNFGEVADGARFVQAAQGQLDGSGIATFSDRARDAARGGGCCDAGIEVVRRQGWLNGLHYAPNDDANGTRAQLLQAADLLRVGLAGSLRDYVLETHTGERRALQHIDYAGGQPAGYAAAPGEVVNYVENHDNPTLFDINVMKLARDTPRADRARVQVLGAALVAFSQGIAYFHAGQDLLRSKSLDRNSFDSGDWFNRVDWSYQRNHFGIGLPPRPDNGEVWPWMQPRLADASIAPSPDDIAYARDAFRDLLRIRASTTLFRLRDASSVRARLRFHGTGPAQQPTLLALELDGRGLEGANFRALLAFINADPQPQALTLGDARGAAWTLHPVHRDPAAGDARAREAQFEAATGRFRIPARTAVVFVVE